MVIRFLPAEGVCDGVVVRPQFNLLILLGTDIMGKEHILYHPGFENFRMFNLIIVCVNHVNWGYVTAEFIKSFKIAQNFPAAIRPSVMDAES